jgi:hypothetical protein
MVNVFNGYHLRHLNKYFNLIENIKTYNFYAKLLICKFKPYI